MAPVQSKIAGEDFLSASTTTSTVSSYGTFHQKQKKIKRRRKDERSLIEEFQFYIATLKDLTLQFVEYFYAGISTIVFLIDSIVDTLFSLIKLIESNVSSSSSSSSFLPSILSAFGDRPLTSTLPVLFVFHIILLVYMAFAQCAAPAAGLSFMGSDMLLFHSVTALSLISYYRAVVTDAGTIPKSDEWTRKPSDDESERNQDLCLAGEVKKSTGRRRFCNKEKLYKPDRAHFCSPLGRNVLKMDHYCPWLSNCVGFRNHKFFFLFLIFACISCNTASFELIRILLAGHSFLLPPQLFFISQGLCLSGLLSIILTPFTAFHFWLISNNMTTIEFCEKRRSSSSSQFVNVYDLGFFQNWGQVLGSNPLFWFLPIQTLSGDGLRFTRNRLDYQPHHEKKEDDSLGASCVEVSQPVDSMVYWWGTVLDACNQVNDFSFSLATGFFNIFGRNPSSEQNIIASDDGEEV